MNPSETSSRDREQFDVVEIDEDKKLSREQIDGMNQAEQLGHPFEIVPGGNTQSQSRDLLRARHPLGSSSGPAENDTVETYGSPAVHREPKRDSSQQVPSIAPGRMVGNSSASSKHLVQGRQQHPDETLLSFPHVVSFKLHKLYILRNTGNRYIGQTAFREPFAQLNLFFSHLKLMDILSNDMTHDIASWLPHVSNVTTQQSFQFRLWVWECA
jgi:hypothetical protein